MMMIGVFSTRNISVSDMAQRDQVPDDHELEKEEEIEFLKKRKRKRNKEMHMKKRKGINYGV